MIRALVVDDEKLVRKGFISMIDWASHGIVIAGEASDGTSALDWMGSGEVDLLFTDITMPRMDGFELIKQVRHKHPQTQSVVLTCHHEFDYVQEALRLGAIDYIVKTLLEMDSVDDVVQRIVERYRWERGKTAGAADSRSQQAAVSGQAIVFIPREHNAAADSGELFRLPLAQGSRLTQLDNGAWLSLPSAAYTAAGLDRELGDRLHGQWRPVIVAGLEGRPIEEARRLVNGSSLASRLFYAPDQYATVTYKADDLRQAGSGSGNGDVAKEKGGAASLPEQWHALRWALHPDEWKRLLAEAERLTVRPDAWAGFARTLCADWKGLLFAAEESRRLMESSGRNRTWSDWREWLGRAAAALRNRMDELSMSKEVMGCLIQAVIYMRSNAGDKINQSDVAARVSMSRSYFSQCFAKLAGESFGETLRSMRIDMAKRLLRESDAPVYEIAQRAGFEDDKYFSRVFRERVGVLPSEFRAAAGRASTAEDSEKA